MELNDNATIGRRAEHILDITEKVRIAQDAVASLGDSDFFMVERRVNGSFGFTRTIKALEAQYYLLTNEDPT
jgi:hypothetical protein